MIPEDHFVYSTDMGQQFCGDSREMLRQLADGTIDLILTSPPFALLRKKPYGNERQEDYVSWLGEFGRVAFEKLKDTGSFVLDLGGAYEKGRPIRSLYNYRVLLEFCDNLGYRLAEEFFWFNPAKLPSPIEWVNKKKIRAKDSVNTVWWFSKTDEPKADVRNVLTPYSERMKKLLENPAKFYQPKKRPSGHDISIRFEGANGGAIPSNLLQISNTDSNSHYLRICKALGRKSHSARFPTALPRFFIKFLTGPGDLVVDIFSGSNTTGYVAEQLERRWLSVELDRSQAILSAVRFMEGSDKEAITSTLGQLERGQHVHLESAPKNRHKVEKRGMRRQGRRAKGLLLFE
jgi:DNA modification methylase